MKEYNFFCKSSNLILKIIKILFVHLLLKGQVFNN